MSDAEPGFRVSIKDVWVEVQELKQLIAERLPDRLADRLSTAEETITRHDEQIKTLFSQRAPKIHPAQMLTTIAASLIAAVALLITFIKEIAN